MALSDTLTGLPNRLHLRERLEKLASWSRASETPFAVLVMDLDHFKHVNDTCGHDVGDQLLQQAANRLAGCLRRSERGAAEKCSPTENLECEFLARTGGDEFAAILPGAMDRSAAETVARRMAAALDQPITIGNRKFEVAVSIGIARCPRDSSDPAMLLQLADRAMYDAKQRNCGYAFFEDIIVQRKAV
jgi:GGDEF domain-containing protein